MSAVKGLWISEVEQIEDDYAFDRLTRDEAMEALQRKGFNASEASEMLDAVTA